MCVTDEKLYAALLHEEGVWVDRAATAYRDKDMGGREVALNVLALLHDEVAKIYTPPDKVPIHRHHLLWDDAKLMEQERTPWHDEMDALCAKRVEARSRKDWKTADALRDEMEQQGAVLFDYPDGRSSWMRL